MQQWQSHGPRDGVAVDSSFFVGSERRTSIRPTMSPSSKSNKSTTTSFLWICLLFGLVAERMGVVEAWVSSSSSRHHHQQRRWSQPPSSSPSSSSSPAIFLSASQTSLPDTSKPMAPHTFGGMVERGLLERFDETEIERVLASWRLLDQDYYHRQTVLGCDDKIVQECHSYVPGLSIQPFWDADQFDWAQHLEKSYNKIRQEFDTVTANLSQLQAQGNNIWAGALTEDACSYGEGWKTLVLMNRGRWDPVNSNLFPETSRAIHESGVPVTEVFFASMSPHTDIKIHSDFTNFVLTSHLAVDIPYSGTNQCRLTVGNETKQWINGEVMVFDTSLLHDAINESDKTRYILMLRIWHPDLTPTERRALQFTFDALELPGLVSDDAGERFMAEQTAQAVRAFPLLSENLRDDGGDGASKGFGSTTAGGAGKKNKNGKSKTKSKTKGFGG